MTTLVEFDPQRLGLAGTKAVIRNKLQQAKKRRELAEDIFQQDEGLFLEQIREKPVKLRRNDFNYKINRIKELNTQAENLLCQQNTQQIISVIKPRQQSQQIVIWKEKQSHSNQQIVLPKKQINQDDQNQQSQSRGKDNRMKELLDKVKLHQKQGQSLFNNYNGNNV